MPDRAQSAIAQARQNVRHCEQLIDRCTRLLQRHEWAQREISHAMRGIRAIRATNLAVRRAQRKLRLHYFHSNTVQ
jgi:multidrug resistance efflux pump